MEPLTFTPWIWRDPAWPAVSGAAFDPARGPVGGGEPPETGLIGYRVEATDGSLGKVDGEHADVPEGCLLIDTGLWIFGSTVVLPVGLVSRIDHEQRTIYLDRTKEQIKAAPEYDPEGGGSDDFRHRADEYYTECYRLLPPLL
ncbi:PRC-barrel domain containing protein [Actinosynnema sp. NPDC023587]|uniref:PRC-barrel domain containing protein n=1 Tax=Actinosynnema sp. NPDC023587 TaxID=3154695 RepID=UPI0033D30E03